VTSPTPPIARLDVPLAVLEQQIAGLLAEQRHQYLDLDTDSACCPDGFTCPACPPKTPGSPS